MTANGMKHGMHMRYPATRWQDALPTGSGLVGALIYGQIRNETILLNHDALYYPRGKAELVDVSDLLPEVRRLISIGRYKDAADLMPAAYAERMAAKGASTSYLRDPYQPFCTIRLHAVSRAPFRDYRRGVDFSTGRAWVQWSENETVYTRETFVSRISDTVFLRVRGSRLGAVSCRVALAAQRNEQSNPKLFFASGDVEAPAARCTAHDNGTLTFAADYPNGSSFGAAGHVATAGGRVRTFDNELVVEDADEIVVRVGLYIGEDPDIAVPRLLTEFEQLSADFDAALEKHSELHAELFGRMTLELEGEERHSNEEMLITAYGGDVPTSLILTMFEFGRYLLICSSRPGGRPANLQGIWNGDYSPAWDSDFHTDENVQMNYWQALPGGLYEAALPFFEYFEKCIEDYRENAAKIFGCRGILASIAQTTHGREYPRVWSNWTAGAGWIGQHFYDYYLFTGDIEFLRNRAVPWLKEVALFYQDFLVEGDGGRLLFSPSLSPENRPAGDKTHLITMNAAMDIAVCREVLQNLCSACELLGMEAESVQRWRSMLAKLPRYAVNREGAFAEWLHPAFKDNYRHRHHSHLYPLFPGIEITEDTNPEIYEACRVVVEKKMEIGIESQLGWSMAHMANIYARLGMGTRALECLEILSRSSVGPNLFTYLCDWRDMGLSKPGGADTPFQIDANLGMSAAVLEMLVFSKPGRIKLLPALPGKWVAGRATGICCRGGIKVDMEWDMRKGSFSAALSSGTDREILVSLPGFAENTEFDQPQAATPSGKPRTVSWNVALRANVPIHVHTRPESPIKG